MELHERLERVRDWPTFLAFVKQLQADREAAAVLEGTASAPDCGGANGWQNRTIEDFLEGAIAWAEATQAGETQGLSADNPWKQFAVFLYCGKIYE